MKPIINTPCVQFITQGDHLASARAALDGGCRWVQLRVKNAEPTTLRTLAHDFVSLCHEYGAVSIIDDYTRLAREVGADGVHLGANDMSPTEARAILGPDAIIGATVNYRHQIASLPFAAIDYIGAGPYRFTTTKQRLAPVLGLDGLASLAAEIKAHAGNIPIVAIGGIGLDDIRTVMTAGVSGVALSGDVAQHANPTARMRQIIERTLSLRLTL